MSKRAEIAQANAQLTESIMSYAKEHTVMAGLVYREGVKYGYEQAEKDLALSVEDVLLLMHIWTELPDLQFKTLKAIAEETLKRFNEQRNDL